MVLRLLGSGVGKFLADPWNIFDVVVNAAILTAIVVPTTSVTLNFLKALRLYRIFPLTNQASGFQTVVITLTNSLPGILNVGMLLLLFYFVYGVAGMVLFGTTRSGVCLDGTYNFHNIGNALLLLVSISTTDRWPCFMEDCMITSPRCTDGVDVPDCGGFWFSAVYFVTFYIGAM